jgi:hypothetical protein
VKYDYTRFVNEEVKELIDNFMLSKSTVNKTLFVDDLADSLWVCLAALPASRLPELCITIDKFLTSTTSDDALDYLTTQSGVRIINRRLRQYNSFITSNNEELWIVPLEAIICELMLLAEHEGVDIIAAFEALCDENNSKLDFPINCLQEVFRDGKLNRKDIRGGLYPWVKMTDFSKFYKDN